MFDEEVKLDIEESQKESNKDFNIMFGTILFVVFLVEIILLVISVFVCDLSIFTLIDLAEYAEECVTSF